MGLLVFTIVGGMVFKWAVIEDCLHTKGRSRADPHCVASAAALDSRFNKALETLVLLMAGSSLP